MYALFKLKAKNKIKDIDRFYDICIQEDLFSNFSFTICHGRNGFQGRKRHHIFEDSLSLVSFLNKNFKRRLNAMSRLGTNYEFASIDFDSEFKDKIFEKLNILLTGLGDVRTVLSV